MFLGNSYQKLLLAITTCFIVLLSIGLKQNSDLVIELIILCFILFGLTLYIFQLDRFPYFVLLVTILFSVDVPILGSNRISFPDEILISLMAIISVIHILWEMKFLKKIFKSPLALISLCYVAILFVTSAFSSMPTISIKFSLINILFIGCGLFSTFMILDRKKWSFQQFLHLLSIPLVLLIIYIIIHFSQYNFSSKAAIEMALPFFKDHTLLSACLCMFIPLYLFYPIIYTNSNIYLKVSAILLAVLLLVIIMISSSRASWLSLVLSLCFYLFIRIKGNMKGLIILLTIFIGVGYLFSSSISEKLNANSNSSSSEYAGLSEQVLSISNVKSDVSNLERINRWKCAIRMFKDKPIVGFGPGTYQFQYLTYQQQKDKTAISVDNPFNTKQGYGGSAHSEYFLILSEMGILGFITWLGIIFTIFHTFFRIYYKSIHHQNKYISLSIILSLVTFLSHSFFNNFLNTAKTGLIFWILIGFLVFMNNKLLQDEERI